MNVKKIARPCGKQEREHGKSREKEIRLWFKLITKGLRSQARVRPPVIDDMVLGELYSGFTDSTNGFNFDEYYREIPEAEKELDTAIEALKPYIGKDEATNLLVNVAFEVEKQGFINGFRAAEALILNK